MFEYFTDKAIAVVMKAQEEARRLGHNFVGTEQVLLGLISVSNGIASQVLDRLGVRLEAARVEVESIIGRGAGRVPSEIPFTPKAKRIFEQAVEESRRLDHRYIGPEHLLLGLTRDPETVAARVMQNLGVELAEVRRQVIQAIGEEPATAAVGSRAEQRNPFGRSQRSNKVLAEFGVDLTEKAAQGKLDPVVGRQKEIERVIQILGRRTKNNPILIGEPGVGKTAIAEGLAQRIINQDVPETMQDKQVIQLDMGLLVSGTRFRGDFEERLTKVLSEVRESGNIILVIDEIHTLVGAGSLDGGLDASNMLKPALARGELQCIGATTLDEYRQHFERDAALERRFQPVKVGEPTAQETLEILYGLRGRYEQHHRLTISNEALDAAVKLADRYITDRFLPDKAIDLIDEAGSRVRLRHAKKSAKGELRRDLRKVAKELNTAVQVQDFEKASELRDREIELQGQIQAETQASEAPPQVMPVVDEEDIAHIVASWTGVPVTRLTESESAMLLHLEDTLHERLIGQNEAVSAVARSIRRARTGLGNPERPIASFIFSGPTGVGKTELTKAVAAAVFGSEDAMIRLDMSEFMERHTVSKLIGSPPGFVGYDEGGQLTEAVRRRPYTVLLLDEIEKAHPDVFNTLLQLLDDGRLTDAKGRVVSFKNTIVIMTSNIGSRVIEKGGGGIGFDFTDLDASETQYRRIQEKVNEELKQYFRPEFLNRLDEIIVFRQLTKPEVTQIADLLLDQVMNNITDRNITLEVSDAMKERIIAEGYDPSYGARPLRRAIARLIEDNLAEALLEGRVNDGDTAVADLDDDGNVLIRSAKEPALIGARQH
ncbi:MAG: ATP-dependent Clp protease ATP-binding subunit [Thainema sp.]